MAHMPMDDAQELWNDTPKHDWKALHKTLEEHKGKTEGISDNLIDMLLPGTDHLEKEGKPYPKSSKELYDVLNDELKHEHEEHTRH